MMTIIVCIAVLLVFVSLVHYLSKRKFDFWNNRCVPFEPPIPVFGNFSKYILLKEYWGKVTQVLCRKYSKEPYFGVFYGTEPALVVQDPELIKLITTKDFYYFNYREVSDYTHKETNTQNLFFTQGDRWRVMRQNLTPLFSSAKMKSMFPLIETCGKTFESMLREETKQDQVIDIKTTMVRYAMTCITSCVFGIDTDVMGKDSSKNPFIIMGDLVLESSKIRGFKMIARAMWPSIFYGLGFKLFPTEIDRFFNKLMTDVFENRQYKSSARNDFVDLLLQLKRNQFLTGDKMTNDKTEKEKTRLEVTDQLLIAQCIMFFAAGFETSASTMTFTLYELAKHEDVQKRVCEEVDEYLRKTGGKLAFDSLNELPYLEACVDEAMRLYPVLGVITREVVADYQLPTGLLLPRGLRVHLPVYHLHHNAEYFPDPEEYRPERFLPEQKKLIVPYTYMPFGEGHRICIGMRFAKMKMMVGMVTLLKNFNFQLADGMPRTLEFEATAIVTQSTCPIRLKLIPRS